MGGAERERLPPGPPPPFCQCPPGCRARPMQAGPGRRAPAAAGLGSPGERSLRPGPAAAGEPASPRTARGAPGFFSRPRHKTPSPPVQPPAPEHGGGVQCKHGSPTRHPRRAQSGARNPLCRAGEGAGPRSLPPLPAERRGVRRPAGTVRARAALGGRAARGERGPALQIGSFVSLVVATRAAQSPG